MSLSQSKARSTEPPKLAALTRTTLEAFFDLLSAQLRLAKVEAVHDARVFFGSALKVAVFLPLLFVGYLFFCAALTSVLVRWMGWPAALAVVASVNLIVGAIGCVVMIRRMTKVNVMETTVTALETSANDVETVLKQ